MPHHVSVLCLSRCSLPVAGLALIVAVPVSACFSEPPTVAVSDDDDDDNDGTDGARGTGGNPLGVAATGGTTGPADDSHVDGSGDAPTTTGVDVSTTDGEPSTGRADASSGDAEASTGDQTTGGVVQSWPADCLSPTVTAACGAPLVDEMACQAGPTMPVPGPGCDDTEEFRVPVTLSPGTYLVALVDPAAPLASPQTTMTIVGSNPGMSPVQCLDSATQAGGPVATVALTEANYDVVVTTEAAAVEFPIMVRDVATLCEVDAACCSPGGPEVCPHGGLRECVGALDAYCIDSEWDAQCVTWASVACGAACALP